MSSFTRHFTREAANSGLRCDLVLPDGSPSGDWVHLLSVDSDAFRAADRKAKRKLFEWSSQGTKTEEEKTAFYHEQEVELLSSLIESWSFTEECNDVNKRQFLKEAPQIAEFINKQSVRRSAFFKRPSTGSASMPNESSS